MRQSDGVVAISICTTSCDDEYTGRESDSVTTESAGKTVKSRTREILWLKYLMRFCTEVSVVGLRYVANPSASTIRRSIWLLLVLAGTAFTTYLIEDRIAYYFSHPVRVVIRDEHMEEIRFPTVTICSENRASLAMTKAVERKYPGRCVNRNFSNMLLFRVSAVYSEWTT